MLPQFTVLEECATKARATTAEIIWIEIFRSRGAKLFNKENPDRAQPRHAGDPWTKTDDNRLLRYADNKMPMKQMTDLFGRSRGAITSRLRYLREKRRRKRPVKD